MRSVREEYLDKLIILNERRPHQGLDQDSPPGLEPIPIEGSIRHREVLGGIIRDYYWEAA